MSTIRILALAAALLGVAVALADRPHPAPALLARAPVRPNVLLVSIDSLRADHLSSYGYARMTSPTIDRLAREGVLFTTAISSASWTIPAHMTLLTALPPEVHRVNSHRRALRPEARTLAEELHDAGYATAGFVSGATVMARYGFAQGFDLYDESLAAARVDAHRGVTSPGLVERVDAYLTRWAAGMGRPPFFVFLHMWDVHYDYAPPPPYDRMFDPGYDGDLTSENFESNARIHRAMDSRDLEHLIALYDGEIRFTDEHLGRIVERLRELRVLDDTIVVVTSDHGDEFFEHGLKGHAKTLYDEIVRVPLVMRAPGRIPEGQRIDRQVRLMDVAPTILGLAGVAPTPEFGRTALPERYRFADLTPWISARHPASSFPELPAFSESTSFLGPKWSLRTQQGKLMRFPAKHRDGALFDLEEDPGEQINLLAGPWPDAQLADLGASFDAWVALTRQEPTHAQEVPRARRDEARLRALGYIQ